MSVANETFDEVDPTTFATRTSADRSRAAKQQARDRFGRWITEGASVQWRNNEQDYAGTIQRIENGQAVVKVKNADDTGAILTLPPKSLRVTTSKASLKNEDIPPMADEDTNEEAIVRPEFTDELNEKGTAAVKRPDGYFIEAHKKAEIGGNPFLYQLYAPNGRSLGKFTQEAVVNFEDMITEDKNQSEETPTSTTDDVAPTSPDAMLPGGPVAASAFVVRVARDGNSLIVNENSEFKIVDKHTGETFVTSKRLDTLVASGSWRRAVGSEKELSSHTPSIEDIEIAITTLPQYRVPNSVKEAITASLEHVHQLELNDDDHHHINALATDELVALDSVKWINKFFTDYEKPENIHGGFQGKKWASKILSKEEIVNDDDKSQDATYDTFDDDTFVYLGIGHDKEGGTSVSELASIDLETDAVYMWRQGEFVLQALAAEDLDAPSIIVLDAETAKTVARWIDVADATPVLDVLDVNPEERNLFSLAYADLDFEEIDRVSTIIADASGYTPVERSVNAQRQKRGPGGKFGGEQVEQSSVLTEGITKKATLPFELPLIENIQALIADWLETAEDFAGTVTAAGEQIYGGSPIDFDAEVSAEAEPVVEETTEEAPVAEEAPATTDSNILYFAIVDPIDKTAVTDVVALIKKEGQPSAWLRSGGTWIRSAEKLSDLQGPTPPAVVKLEIPEPVKGVLGQIDVHDQEKGVDTTEMPIAASGFALFDNTLEIFDANDLVKSVFTASQLSESEYLVFAKQHIRKRARALNRMDLVPVEWRSPSIREIGIIEYNTSPLMGEFGEIIPAVSTFKDYSPTQREHAAEKGNAMSSGAYPINNVQDLKNAIKAFGRAKESEKSTVKKHIIKHAKKLNHPELIPDSWGVTASGIPGIADTPADFKNVERLMNYWAHGKGAAKIRWGTPGDLTRAHRHLVKYVGPLRAWGLAQNLHKRVFGVPNITHDRATGQYRGKR